MTWTPWSLPVQHVASEEREARLHRGVVAGGADLAHRADHVAAGGRLVQLPGAELTGLNRSRCDPECGSGRDGFCGMWSIGLAGPGRVRARFAADAVEHPR